MIDPKEKSAHEQEELDAAREQSSGNENNTGKNTNWNEHQQIDEEGNEVDPDDIK